MPLKHRRRYKCRKRTRDTLSHGNSYAGHLMYISLPGCGVPNPAKLSAPAATQYSQTLIRKFLVISRFLSFDAQHVGFPSHQMALHSSAEVQI